MKKSIFYHAGCPVCAAAEHEILSLLGTDNLKIVDVSNSMDQIKEAEKDNVKSVPALVTPSGNVLHINFGASLDELKN